MYFSFHIVSEYVCAYQCLLLTSLGIGEAKSLSIRKEKQICWQMDTLYKLLHVATPSTNKLINSKIMYAHKR